MATHGLAAQSKDNPDLIGFLISAPQGHKSMDLVLQHLHIGSSKILGDLLTLLINCSIDARCAELMVQKKVIRKAMRLLDSISHASPSLPSDSLMRSLQELTLILVNNLTASYVIAVDDFLQKEDEDMRGFYLGKIQAFYTSAMEEKEKDGKTSEGDENKKEKKDNAAAVLANRDVARWMLQIVLNLSRCVDGQEQILSDDRWQNILQSSLESSIPSHRLLAAQVLRNCACGSHPFFSMIVKGGGLLRAVQRLTDSSTAASIESIAEIQQCLAEFVSSMLESEEGVAQLESINAKKLFTAAVARSLQHTEKATGVESRVEEVQDGEVEEEGVIHPSSHTDGLLIPVLSTEAREYIERHILCHLDDVVDAYLAPGGEELD